MEQKKIKQILKSIRQDMKIAKGDEDKSTSIEDVSYYSGLYDGLGRSKFYIWREQHETR